MQQKITSEHLSRQAYVYIRQSSMAQVRDHLESQRLQYRLEERAKLLGWPTPVMIDDDLGLSGSGRTVRPGFAQLLTAVCANTVGAIFCLEASRLARNNREWSQLIDFCAIVKTLLIDLDGIYDPCNVSDRVFLGLKGTMSEYELGIFRQRAQAAIQEKARRGELFLHVPAGYLRTPSNRCEMEPDQRIRQAIMMVFMKFREFGSASQVVLWFRSEGLEVPIRGANGTIIWKLPTMATITGILKNPIYAGAYVYGRRETRMTIVNGQPVKSSHEVAMEHWKVLLQDHHQAYISWDEYLANQKRLQQNANQYGAAVKGSPKKGAALLVGLLRCQKCGHRFEVRYKGVDSATPRYVCPGQAAASRKGRCLEFYGTQLEAIVVREVLRVIEPAALGAAEEAERLYQQRQGEKEQYFINALSKAEYEATRCYEQYNQIDARNRLVAQTLEENWENALQKVEVIKQQLEQIRQEYQPLAPEDRKKLYELAADLPRVWNHPQADVRIKKRILETIIREIMVDLDTDHHLTFSIHWAGGKHTQYRIKRRQRGERENHLHPETEKIVRGLAETAPDKEIARILNLLKIKTASGKTWIAARVASFRQQHQIAAFNPADYAKKGLVNLGQAAEILGINAMAVYRLLNAKVLSGRQIVRYAPWVIEKEHLHAPAVQKLVAGLKEKSKILLTRKPQNPNQLSLE